MEIVLKNAKLLAKEESPLNKGRSYDAPQISFDPYMSDDVIVMSLGDVSGDNEFGDDFS